MRGAPGDERGALANTVEGYLLARTHHDQAEREAEALCARMPWLTTAQAEDVTRHYLRQRVDLTRQMLLTTTERAAQLRQEYEDRYAALRRDLLRRHAACACAVLACTGGVSTLVCLLGR
ncbi:hypothetical protein [Streptomyces sp. ALI-76-A]|jgi:hypothetical protein|uniref:hypothetical protein n=1 Tax=Streptomyces sp. ALI-76-A TaxID=3025736 RepID=UPI00256ED045|nr:hypothetical protein [Streptomyces sp. ALI-76-A]MDL5199303.1 hypothetical protein [Streptomyces sp. ALI-76-A]